MGMCGLFQEFQPFHSFRGLLGLLVGRGNGKKSLTDWSGGSLGEL